MKTVDDSLFAVLRIVMAMLHADGQVTPDEHAWWKHILTACSLTPAQEQQLALDRQTTAPLAELFQQIRTHEDRQRLHDLLLLAMQIDGAIDLRERELFDHMDYLIRQEELNPAALAEALVTYERRQDVWRALGAFGKFLKRRIRYPGFWLRKYWNPSQKMS